MSLVNLEKLTVRYGPRVAVDRLTLSIPQGEVFGFIGPNGAGKTSTMKVLATLLKPASGRVFLDGIDVLQQPRLIRPRIGYMPDFFGVYEDLTVREYLHFFAAAYRLVGKSRREAVVADVLALTDLTEQRDLAVDALSRGMKQRLGIARVLLHDPQFLILDEPASGLDPRARLEMRELLKELRQMGKTILISSHILSELAECCTRIGILEAGKLVAEGSLAEIYQKIELRRTIHVQITNRTPDLLGRIRETPGLTSVEEEVDRLVLGLDEEQLTIEALLGKIIGLGAAVRMFQPQALDLETAFLKLTEGKLR